jgi:hypothetical protein
VGVNPRYVGPLVFHSVRTHGHFGDFAACQLCSAAPDGSVGRSDRAGRQHEKQLLPRQRQGQQTSGTKFPVTDHGMKIRLLHHGF